jgi:3-oxoacyl-[acyl-carrier protein] reductase
MSLQIDLSGKVVLITGATGGIGRAMALTFAKAGARVGLNHLGDTSIARDLIAEIERDGGEALALDADVSDGAAVDRIVNQLRSRYGRIDCLVNNAGVVQVKPFLETSEQDWQRVIQTNLTSMFLTCRYVLPLMQAQGDGVVINIASELAWLGRAQYAAYTAAKGGVVALTRSLAREFAPSIRINGIAPGPVDTPMLRSEFAVTQAEADEADIPAARLGRPEEIAATAVFLASPLASFYYGEIVSPNGGALMR